MQTSLYDSIHLLSIFGLGSDSTKPVSKEPGSQEKKLTKEELRSLEGEMEKDVDSCQDNQEKEKVEKDSSLSLSLDLESLRCF